MAVYFIKSETPTSTQDGSVECKVICSSADYNEMVKGWNEEVAKKAKCDPSQVVILSVSRLG